jgi:hypothetical protein
MFLHLITEHPMEFAQSEAGRQIISEVQKAAYGFGEKLSNFLRGKK